MTRLGEKIRVESLDDIAVARVERQVLSLVDLGAVEPTRAGWLSVSLRWAVPAVAVAGVALAIFLNVRSSLSTQAPAVSETTSEPTTLSTGADTARLAIDGAVIVLGANARADLIRHADGGTTVVLSQGRVDCEVEPRHSRPPFVVDAGKVEVKVIGTVFAVERNGDDVEVEVTRGKVEVSNPAGNRHVAAGQSWNDEADRVVALAAVAPQAPDAPVASEPAGAVEVAAVDVAAGDAASKARAGDAETKTERSRRAPRARRAAPKPQPEQTGPVTLTRPPRGTAPAQLEDTRALETRKPAEAADRYFQIAYKTGRGNVASYAMYSLAYLQMFELGQAKKAIETAGHYRRRFRKGRESRAALWLSVRATCKVASDDDCRDAAQSYVARYPSGRHADQARWLVRR